MANNAYKQTILELEQRRFNASNLKDERLNEVYKKIPKLKENRELLKQTSINITKALLKGEDKEKLINELKETNLDLQEYEKFLLTSNGYKDDYLKNVYVCNICEDRGFIDNKKCKCFDQLIIEKLYQISNLKDVIKYENFDTFDVKYFSETDIYNGLTPRQVMINNYKIAETFVNEFDKNYRNLFMYGNVGLGKSFLCNCIAKELLDKGKVVLYVSAIELFKKLEEFKFHRNDNNIDEEFIDYLTKSDLLIIDDLGTETQTLFTNSELFNIINKRHTQRKHTIISTNIDINEIANIYSHRLESRFIGNFETINFIGEDVRILKKFT